MSERIVIYPQTQYKATTFQIVYYDEDGKRRKQTEKSKLEAENFRQELIEKRNKRKLMAELKARGLYTEAKALEKPEPKLIQAALKDFVKAKEAAALDPKDLRSLRIEKLAYNLFGEFIIDEQERTTVEEITLLDLEKFREKLQGTGIKNATVARKETSVKAFLNYCVSHKYVTENVAVGLKKLTIKTPKRILYKSDEKESLKAALPTWARELFIALEEIMARPIELERAKIGDIDWTAPSIMLSSSKGNKIIEREIPLTERAVGVLRDVVSRRQLSGRGDPDDLIFRNSIGNQVCTDVFNRAVRVAREELGLPPGATPYALRHEGINELSKLKVPMRMISTIAGHRKPQTTMQYMQETNEEMRNVINMVEAAKKKKAQVS